MARPKQNKCLKTKTKKKQKQQPPNGEVMNLTVADSPFSFMMFSTSLFHIPDSVGC